MKINSIHLQKLPLTKLVRFLNIAGPVAGATAALSPLILFLWNSHPQYLDVGATFNRYETIRLEVASQPKQISKGMKFRFRWDIPSNQGMLFTLNKKPEISEVTTNHYLMSVDIIFLKDNIVRSVIRNAPPCFLKNKCPKYSSIYPVNQMIQVPGGSISTIDLQPEDKIGIKMLKQNK